MNAGDPKKSKDPRQNLFALDLFGVLGWILGPFALGPRVRLLFGLEAELSNLGLDPAGLCPGEENRETVAIRVL